MGWIFKEYGVEFGDNFDNGDGYFNDNLALFLKSNFANDYFGYKTKSRCFGLF